MSGDARAWDLVPLEALDPAGVAAVRRIYEAGFAAHLRAPFIYVSSNRQPGEQALALASDGQPAGFALLRPLGPTGWVFLRYYVVDEARRGQGLGGVFWARLTGWLRESGCPLLVWDVEDPAEPGTAPAEVRTRWRRVAFYERQGGSVLPVSGYLTPHDDAEDGDGGGEGDGEWAPMRLMAAGLGPGEPPTATAAGLRAVVEAVYRWRWSLPPDHPQVVGTTLAGPA